MMEYIETFRKLLVGKYTFLADLHILSIIDSLEQYKMTPIEELFFIYFYSAKDLLCNENPKVKFSNAYKDIEIEESKILIIPQCPIEKYRVDFLIIYKDFRIIVECDGHNYHEKTKEQAKHDKKRDRFLTKHGFTVFRFTGSEIFNDPALCVAEIFEYLLDGANSEHENKKFIRDFILCLRGN